MRALLVRLLGGLALCSIALDVAAVGVGQVAPAFTLPNGAGESLVLNDLRGQVVYVDFWASWCGPCKRSFPWMNELQQKYGGKGLVIIAINVDKKREDAQRFLSTTPAQFRIVYDVAGLTPAAFEVKGMPSSYLIDAQGRVVAAEQGFREEQKAAVEERIRALLAAR